ncbi:hypothetical protein D3C74_418490 [compost metagenome]
MLNKLDCLVFVFSSDSQCNDHILFGYRQLICQLRVCYTNPVNMRGSVVFRLKLLDIRFIRNKRLQFTLILVIEIFQNPAAYDPLE